MALAQAHLSVLQWRCLEQIVAFLPTASSGVNPPPRPRRVDIGNGKSVSMAMMGVGMVFRFSIFSLAACFCLVSSVMSRIYSRAPLILPLASLIGAPVYLMGMITPSAGLAMVCAYRRAGYGHLRCPAAKSPSRCRSATVRAEAIAGTAGIADDQQHVSGRAAMTARVPEPTTAFEVRLRGRVQGVGFRPTVWRIAHELGFAGEVLNDGEGVLIRVRGEERPVAQLIDAIARRLPPLAAYRRSRDAGALAARCRRISASPRAPAARAHTAGDAGCRRSARSCAAEIADPAARRYRYPFTNCTHCGPRFSIVRAIPYDRARTTMAAFPLCAACRREYGDPADRRFHAQPIACPACGPRRGSTRFDGDGDCRALSRRRRRRGGRRELIAQGEIVAIKGLGGYHLACDATNAEAVARLRRRKRRDAKPFALMARDLDVDPPLLRGSRGGSGAASTEPRGADRAAATRRAASACPTRSRRASTRSASCCRPRRCISCCCRSIDGPLVMTSGNLSDEPQATDDEDARARLCADRADFALLHDRDIANRDRRFRGARHGWTAAAAAARPRLRAGADPAARRLRRRRPISWPSAAS